MSLQTIPRPSSGDFATRPENEERRAQAVVKTGLIDAPNADLFQIYCDLAKDLTGYAQARFSLFDGEAQCSMGAAGVDLGEMEDVPLETAVEAPVEEAAAEE